MDHMTEVMSKLSKKTLARVRAGSDITVEKLPTPSVGLNNALKGGLGYGRQTLLWGNKSAGKSSLCLETMGKAQREGKVCALIDAEAAFDPQWAERLGVDVAQLIVSPVKTVSDMVDVGVELMKGGVDIIVVDSISSLLPQSWFDKNDEVKGLDGTRQIGSDSRDIGNAIRLLNYANNNTALILISQIRNQITTYGASGKPTGGNAVMYFSSTSIKLMSSARDDKQITEGMQVGNKIVDFPVGRPVDWLIDYNKIGPPNRVGTYDFYYEGKNIGVDNIGEALDIAVQHGVVDRGSSGWYTIYEKKIQGRPAARNYLADNPEIYDKVVGEIESV